MVKFSTGDEYSTNKRPRSSEEKPSRSLTMETEIHLAAGVKSTGIGMGTGTSTSTSTGTGTNMAAYIDPETLECNICMEPLSSPVYQCLNGHIACFICCKRLHNKCHSCAKPIGNIRCLAIEKVVESVKVGCKYAYNGCTEIIRYSQRMDHESKCMYAPYLCSVSGCSFLGPSQKFSSHFTSVHRASAMQFNYDVWFTVTLDTDEQYCILEGEDIVFLLQNKMKPLGNLVQVICFGPTSLEEHYSYQIEIKKGRRHLTTESFPRSIAQIHETLQDFLLVPLEIYEENGRLTFEISFHRK